MIKCTIISPEGEKIYEDAAAISFRSPKGRADVLPGHCEAFFGLTAGEIKIRRGDGEVIREKIDRDGGLLFVKNDNAVIVL